MGKKEPEFTTEERQLDLGALNAYYVTFGSQFRHEPHPFLAEAHPDGYLTILAPDELSARGTAFAMLDSAWSMIYTEDEFNPNGEQTKQWYPLGSLGTIITTARMKGIPQ